MKIEANVHRQRAAELRSKAQQELDAKAGELDAAKDAAHTHRAESDTYVKAHAAGDQLLREAKQLREQAAVKMREAVGGRGLHALQNVARGFGKMMSALSGQRLETTATLKEDPEAKAASARLSELAASKEAEAQRAYKTATQAYARATAALSSMQGHERAAAAHMAQAGALLGQAAASDAAASLAETASAVGRSVRNFFGALKQGVDATVSDVKMGAQLFADDVKGLARDMLRTGAAALNAAADRLDERPAEKPAARPATSASPGTTSSTGAADKPRRAPLDRRVAGAAASAPYATLRMIAEGEPSLAKLFGPATEGALDKAHTLAGEPGHAGDVRALGEAYRKAAASLGVAVDDKVLAAFADAARASGDAPAIAMGGPKKPETKQAAPAAQTGFEPGKVAFGGAPRGPLTLAAPNIDAPPPGEKKPSESLVALRWSCEAAGIDWTKMTSTTQLKDALVKAGGGLHLKNGASPFEAKKRLAERLGLPSSNEAVHKMDLATVRGLFAEREALGLSRLAPRAELDAALKDAGLGARTAEYEGHSYEADVRGDGTVQLKNPWGDDKPFSVSARDVKLHDVEAALDQVAMTGTALAAQKLETAAKALKAAPNDAAAKAGFTAAAAHLDGAKRAMLDVLRAVPAGDRRILALDTVDAMEVGHGKPGATTKLGAALESVVREPRFANAFERALGLDAGAFRQAADAALRASEWTTLGEMTAPSSTLAFPGPLSGEQRSLIGKLPAAGVKLAADLGLLEGDALSALRDHLQFRGHEGAAAQLLGAARMISSLSQRRDFRTKDVLSPDEVEAELMKNARAPEPKIDAKLVSLLQPVLGDLVRSLRAGEAGRSAAE